MVQIPTANLFRFIRDSSRSLPADLYSRHGVQVWIDFDGTITQTDVLDALIARFAVNESWRAAESMWLNGEIGSWDCLRSEFDVLQLDADQLAAFLSLISVDSGALPLFALLQRLCIPHAILSDGIESFIRTILDRNGIGVVPIRANRVVHRDSRLQLICPHRAADCRSNAAHCKCNSADILGDPARLSIYIGDGRSDLCPARKADIVFAKGALAQLLEKEGIAYLPFNSLNDVVAELNTVWADK